MKCPFCGVATLNLEQHIPYYHPELVEAYRESRLAKLEKGRWMPLAAGTDGEVAEQLTSMLPDDGEEV